MNFKNNILSEFIKKTCIGLTGGAATGKSTIGKWLVEEGYVLVDADNLSRKATLPNSEGLRELANSFGNEILNKDGTLHREKLGQIVFADVKEKKKLEQILHPQIAYLLSLEAENLIVQNYKKIWFYEASLLVETNTYQRFLELWVTDCDKRTQLQRLMSRNQLSEEKASGIIKNQMPQEVKKSVAQFVLNTEKSKDVLLNEIRQRISSITSSNLD